MILQVTKGTGNFKGKMVPLPETNSEFTPENGMFGIRSFPLAMTYFHWKSGCHNLKKKKQCFPEKDDENKTMEKMVENQGLPDIHFSRWFFADFQGGCSTLRSSKNHQPLGMRPCRSQRQPIPPGAGLQEAPNVTMVEKPMNMPSVQQEQERSEQQ